MINFERRKNKRNFSMNKNDKSFGKLDMLKADEQPVPFNQIQGIASDNVPAYSNESNDFISFDACFIRGIYTGYKWQCVEYVRRWLLLRKSCIFSSISSAARMWTNLKYIERVTDGRQFPLKTHSNGSEVRPIRDALLIYPDADHSPFGHVAVIVDVRNDCIRIAEQNHRFHSWPGDYSREIPLIERQGRYFIDDPYQKVFGWMEIMNNEQLKSLNSNDSILSKYQQIQPMVKIERCFPSNSKHANCFYYKVNEDFFLKLSRMSNKFYGLCLQTIENIVFNDNLLMALQISDVFWSRIRHSWVHERHDDIIDYLDFRFDGHNLRFCPFRSQHPLAILQCAIKKEHLIQTMNFDYEFTSSFQLYRLLVRHWKRLNSNHNNRCVHILIDDYDRDMNVVLFMKNIMKDAGIQSKLCLFGKDLFWKDKQIVDQDGERIKIVWKVWNWEIVYRNDCQDRRDRPCIADILLDKQIRILEPIWKSIAYHPLFLSILCAMFPNDLPISQESSSEYSHLNIVCWMINSIFSGFNLCHEKRNAHDSHESLTHCCLF